MTPTEMEPELSLVVSTLGRSNEIVGLLQSLATQKNFQRQFEVIFVDQNEDDRVAKAISSGNWAFPIMRLHQPRTKGVCRGRNAGLHLARGSYVAFPDDDCWYPPWLLAKAFDKLETTKADFLVGRAADESGRSINGRFAKTARQISRSNVWITSIEWMLFGKRECLLALGGYNEKIGPGSGTPWQSSEGQDLLLRALRAGMHAIYDPAFYGHHLEFDISSPDAQKMAKGRAYARGMGFVMKSFNFSPFAIGYWSCRALANAGRALLKGNTQQTRYFMGVAVGRLEGYLNYTIPIGAQAPEPAGDPIHSPLHP